jgi:hypothetical protein
MRIQLTKITLAVGVMLAMAFTFNGCSSGGDDGGGGGDDPFAGIPWYEEMKERVKYYDPDNYDDCYYFYDPNYGESRLCNVRCNNGVPQNKCWWGEWYNPLKQYCGWDDPTKEDEDSFMLVNIERCGNELIRDSWHRCKNGIVEVMCEKCKEETWFNPKTHYDNGPAVYAKERCGSEYYNPNEYRVGCQNGVVGEMCDSGENATWFNPKTHYCDYATYTVIAYERCGSKYYEPSYGRCNNGVVEYRCYDNSNHEYTNNWYNYIAQSCDYDTGTVKNKLRCGN